MVEACVEAGAHHVDISGEPAFLEKMQLKYHQKVSSLKFFCLYLQTNISLPISLKFSSSSFECIILVPVVDISGEPVENAS